MSRVNRRDADRQPGYVAGCGAAGQRFASRHACASRAFANSRIGRRCRSLWRLVCRTADTNRCESCFEIGSEAQ
jgi:hypothetical protein